MTVAIIILALAALIPAFSYYAYRIAFLAPRRSEEEQYALPRGKQYEVFHPHIQKCMDEMRARSYEEVYITSHDGKKLFARYYHSADGAPVQILFHGYKGSAFRDFCGGSKLAMKMKHNALVIDQRSHGKSEGNTITFGIEERRDCMRWIEYACERFGKNVPIILCGLSMGAATVLMVNDQELPTNIKGIIADCPFSSPKEIIKKVGKDMHFPPSLMYPFVKLGARLFGHFDLEEIDAIRAVKQAKVPILLFHGDDDRFVPCAMSEEIKNACVSPVTFEKIPDAGHGLCYMVAPKRYEEATIQFIQSVL